MARNHRDNENPWDKELAMMRIKDLKRAVIMQGMPFEQVSTVGHDKMQRWFVDNFYVIREKKLLDEYDEYLEKLWISKGYKKDDPEENWRFDPALKMGFIAEMDEDGTIMKTKRIKGIKKDKKKKRERNNTFGIFAGTAKELTYKCESEDKTLKDTLELVGEKFPTNAVKSIRIWYNRAKKARAK